MRLVITGGGTGGHTSPAVAVYEELLRRDPRLNVLWIGRDGAIEHRICGKLNIPFRSLPVEGWPRAKFVRRGWVAGKLAWSMARVWFYLRNFQPDVVFGVGGYVSLPAMYIAPRIPLNRPGCIGAVPTMNTPTTKNRNGTISNSGEFADGAAVIIQ